MIQQGKQEYALFRVTPLHGILIMISLWILVLGGSVLWRDKLDRDDLRLQRLREGRYVGTVILVEGAEYAPEKSEQDRTFRAVIGFDLHSNQDSVGNYGGVGKIWMQGQPNFWPLEIHYGRIPLSDGPSVFTADIKVAAPVEWMNHYINITGDPRPPSLIFQSPSGNQATAGDQLEGQETSYAHMLDGNVHKGTTEEFAGLVQKMGLRGVPPPAPQPAAQKGSRQQAAAGGTGGRVSRRSSRGPGG